MTAINDFACEDCELIMEAGRGSDDPPACPSCGEAMKLIFTDPPAFQAGLAARWKEADPDVTESDLDELMEEYDEEDVPDWQKRENEELGLI